MIMTFGKHRGRDMAELAVEEPQYLWWVMDNARLENVCRAAREAYLAFASAEDVERLRIQEQEDEDDADVDDDPTSSVEGAVLCETMHWDLDEATEDALVARAKTYYLRLVNERDLTPAQAEKETVKKVRVYLATL